MSIRGQVFQQVAETKEPTFPELRAFKPTNKDELSSGAFVVLFTSENTGFVVASVNKFNPAGRHSTTWAPSEFERFDGFILLHNNSTEIPSDEAIGEMLSISRRVEREDAVVDAEVPAAETPAFASGTDPHVAAFLRALQDACPGLIFSAKA